MRYSLFCMSVLWACNPSNPDSVQKSIPKDTVQPIHPPQKLKAHKPEVKSHGMFIFDPVNHQMMARMQEGQFQEVVQGYHSHLKRNPEDGFARMMLAWAYK